MNRVVITGAGAITPLGKTPDELFSSLIKGKNGIAPITRFDTTGYKAILAAEVKDFDSSDYIDKKEARRMDRFCQFAYSAAVQAYENSGIYKIGDPFRAGVIIGSGIGGLETLENEHQKLIEKGPGRISPFFIPMMIGNMASGLVSIRYGFKGVSLCTTTACASSAHAIGEAFRSIKYGYSDIIIAGGAEATITPIAVAGFSNMTALSQSTNPDEASLPFDSRRNGFVMGEGGAALVLENLEHALSRGATILGEIAGYGATSDAYHMTSPDPEGHEAAMAMSLALRESGLSPDEIGYINAHGTATPVGDKCETAAIKEALGSAAKTVAVSSTKSMTGHLLGAAGAVEALICTLAINNGILPPTINLNSPDPECDLDYVPNKARKSEIYAAISNSFGFGGHNASLVIKKYEK